MAFTDNCSLFVSAHEDGFNRIIHHVRMQRPSLFNYATAYLAERPKLLCEAIPSHPVVLKRSNPLVTIVDPLPVPGSAYTLNFAVQLVDLAIDFHKGSFELPPELNPPLAEQRMALRLKLCGGIGCPGREIEELIPPPYREQYTTHVPKEPGGPIPVQKLTCFCLEVYAVAHFEYRTYYGQTYLEMRLDGLEIVDIEPKGLENSLECYIRTMLQLVVLPKLRILLQAITLELPDWVPATITLAPTAISAAVPNNPAVEEDQVKLFIDVGVA